MDIQHGRSRRRAPQAGEFFHAFVGLLRSEILCHIQGRIELRDRANERDALAYQQADSWKY